MQNVNVVKILLVLQLVRKLIPLHLVESWSFEIIKKFWGPPKNLKVTPKSGSSRIPPKVDSNYL